MVSSDPILLPRSLVEVKDDLPIVSLPHPRTKLPSLFLIRDGIWEIQSVVPPPTCTRSWFYEPSRVDQSDLVLSSKGGRLLFITPFDPFFLLLALFFHHDTSEPFYNPFNQTCNKSNKNDHERFQEMDSIVEKLQESWFFAGDQGRPTNGDFEIFSAEALRHENLSRIFEPLEQDSITTLWRVEPDRVIKELKRKIEQLTKSGLESGREAHTIWARLAAKEIVSLDNTETDNASFLLNEIYKKISLNMIQAYLPSGVSDHLSNLSEFKFTKLQQEIKKRNEISTINSLEIGRRDNNKTGANKSLKPMPNKKVKKNEPSSASNSNNRTIHHFFKSQTSSSK